MNRISRLACLRVSARVQADSSEARRAWVLRDPRDAGRSDQDGAGAATQASSGERNEARRGLAQRGRLLTTRAGARVGEQIDLHVVGVQLKQVMGRTSSLTARCSADSSRSGSTDLMRNGSMVVREGVIANSGLG
jgi:hypothetical protein